MKTRSKVTGQGSKGSPARVARGLVYFGLLMFAVCVAPARAQQQPGLPGSMGFTGGIVASNVPPKMQHVTFSQRLGERLPLDARLRDEKGRDVTLGDYFGHKPLVLAFVYYQCPMLCPLVMNGISSALKVVPFTPGKEFDVVLISFDPRDTPEAANAKKQAHLQHWAAPETADGWHFLTGTEPEIKRVTAAAGRDTSTASSSRRRIFAWRSWIPARENWVPSSRSYCSTASTTIRRVGSMGRRS
jgi:protein SCO1